MKVITFFACCLLTFNGYVQAGYKSKCDIEGWKDENSGTFTFTEPIHDTFRGVVATFKTKNILKITVETMNYLNITWENQTLTFFTADNYENYEKETDYTKNPLISIIIKAECTEATSERMSFILPITDNNNNFPIMNQKHYDYIFGTTIPKGLILTDILPIIATDYDITNSAISFEFANNNDLNIEDNEYFKIETKGEQTSEKEFKTTLTAETNVTAPFNQTFNMVVKDDGHPVRSVSIPVTIVVATPEDLKSIQLENADEVQVKEETMVHPPVFDKHLYLADYSSNHDFKIEEPIIISYGAQPNTELKQKGYENYFKVQFEDETHERIIVIKQTSLPDEIIRSTNIITFEIEAVNQGLNLPGRTALLIRLPNIAKKSAMHSKECDVLNVNYVNSSNGSTFTLLLFLLAVFSIVFINIFVAYMFVNRSKTMFESLK